MANEILSEIRLELGALRADLKEAQKLGEDAGKKSGQSLGDGIEGGLTSAFGGIKGKLLALAASLAGAFTLKESIEAASRQEAAINAMNSAMAISGTYTDAASAHLSAYASALQRTTIYGDEVINQGQAMLISLGKLSGDGLDRATKASLDMAAALGMDVNSAFNLVSKAATGHVAMLGRYGITVKQTGDETRDFANALSALEKRFGGLAALQTNTFDGAMKQAKNAFGDLLEQLGFVVIKSPLVIASVKAITKAFVDTAEAVSAWAKGGDRISEITSLVLEFGHTLVTWVVAPLELAYNIGKIVFDALATGFSVMVQTAITSLRGLAEIGALVSDKFVGIRDDLAAAQTAAEQTTEELANKTQESFGDLFDFDVASTADKYLSKVQDFVDTVAPPVATNFKKISDDAAAAMIKPGFLDNFATGFQNATKTMKDAAIALGTQIHNTLDTGMTNSFAAMGAAMNKGQDGMAAFGSAMLGVLGDIAIQFGSTFIAMGVAKTLLFDPTGPLLIAAGGVLAAIGGALKSQASTNAQSIARKADEQNNPGDGGSPQAAGGSARSSSVASTSSEDMKNNQPATQLQVVVNGNVFDRKETGLVIADIIQEQFARNGTVFTTGGA